VAFAPQKAYLAKLEAENLALKTELAKLKTAIV